LPPELLVRILELAGLHLHDSCIAALRLVSSHFRHLVDTSVSKLQLLRWPADLAAKFPRVASLRLSQCTGRGTGAAAIALQLSSLPRLADLEASSVCKRSFKALLPALLRHVTSLRRVRSISLRNNALAHVPEELFLSMLSLEQLDLACNDLTSLPAALGNLRGLHSLLLSSNQLVQLPPQVSSCSSLTSLSASDNQLAELPEELCCLSRLRRLLVSGNKIEALPESLGALQRLRELDCGDNELLLLPASVGELRELSSLRAGGNWQLAEVPHALSRLTQVCGAAGMTFFCPISHLPAKASPAYVPSMHVDQPALRCWLLGHRPSALVHSRAWSLSSLLALCSAPTPHPTPPLAAPPQMELLDLCGTGLAYAPSWLSALVRLTELQLASNELEVG
jgi:hypothetical protein